MKTPIEAGVFFSGLIFGTGSSIIAKALFDLNSDGKPFAKPLFQTFMMFVGMFLALPLYYLNLYCKSRKAKRLRKDLQNYQMKRQTSTQTEGSEQFDYHQLDDDEAENHHHQQQEQMKLNYANFESDLVTNEIDKIDIPEFKLTWRTILFLAVPSVFDFAATALGNIGLVRIEVSIYQLLKCTVIVFVAFVKRVVIKTEYEGYMWVGVIINMIAVTCVAATSFFDDSAAAKDGPSRSLNLNDFENHYQEENLAFKFKKEKDNDDDDLTTYHFTGVIFVLLSCLVQSFQYVYEEMIMSNEEVQNAVEDANKIDRLRVRSSVNEEENDSENDPTYSIPSAASPKSNAEPFIPPVQPLSPLSSSIRYAGAENVQFQSKNEQSNAFVNEFSNIPPMIVVGLEGFWGIVFNVFLILPLAATISGSDCPPNMKANSQVHCVLENTEETIQMLLDSTPIMILTVAYVLVITGYNVFAVYVTYFLDSVWHAILDNFRPVSVWIVQLILFKVSEGKIGETWVPSSWLQLFGLILLLVGTAIYNGNIKLPCFTYPTWESENTLQGMKKQMSMHSTMLTMSPFLTSKSFAALQQHERALHYSSLVDNFEKNISDHHDEENNLEDDPVQRKWDEPVKAEGKEFSKYDERTEDELSLTDIFENGNIIQTMRSNVLPKGERKTK